jgi:hypothetical protein
VFGGYFSQVCLDSLFPSKDESMEVLTSHDFTQAGLIKTRLLGLIHVRTGKDTGTLKIRGCKDICSSII